MDRELKFKITTIPGQRMAMLDLLEDLSDKGHADVGRVFKPKTVAGESNLDVHILRADQKGYKEIMGYLSLYRDAGDKVEITLDRKVEEMAAAGINELVVDIASCE